MSFKVGIVGMGWVGKAQHELFPDALVYSPGLHLDGREMDADHEKGKAIWEEKFKADFRFEINAKCDIVFIAVPTPCKEEGRLDISAVIENVEWLQVPLIVVRSTVNPGDCDFLTVKYGAHVCMQPEYLGETPQHPLLDSSKIPFLIIGGDRLDREKLITLYTQVYNANIKIRQISNVGAEIIKLSENRAIGWKVAQIQELYDACQAHKVDFYTVRDAVYGDDPRFNLWWTMIYPDKRGFNSKCIPKDIYAWRAWAESAGYTPVLTNAILEKNKEWLKSNEAN